MKSTVVLSAGALLLGGAQALSSSASSSDVGSSTSSSDPSTSTAPASTKGLGNFVYLGCYVDLYHQQRTLTGPSYSDAAGMTWEACAAFCAGSNYFGTEYGTECYCGSSLDQSLKADETECNAPCAGDATEYCGASFRLDIFQNQDYTPPATPTDPATPPAPTGDFQYAQCQTEGAGVRALDGDHTAKDGMTVEICLAYCKGYAYAGLEYGRECNLTCVFEGYCGNTINNGSVFAPPGDCNTPCGGKVTQTCGGPSR
ncbi:WSC-domain-containing protein [Diplogelasinospora grovesii]|uniref:WSC-domain-containing protein n=1 Tax=Diplogelasinospora grovesii TaxID=303347 RepID=A0AAN6NBC0_9PEZI|nr:WSC-domain-containing protein [Diplogelasinospora grovesii]